MKMPKPKPKVDRFGPRRRYLGGPHKMKAVQIFEVTNNPVPGEGRFLWRFNYNKGWFWGTADSAEEALDAAQQYWMRNCRNGQESSEVIK